MSVRVQSEPFDIAAESATIKDTDTGAIVTFTGCVRGSDNGKRLISLTLEHYPAMTQRELEAIEREAHQRWPLQKSLIVHRYGTLKPGDDIVLVITASRHRAAAFEAAKFLMDFLKTKAPFWKREEFETGDKTWVGQRTSDTEATDRWTKSK